MKNQLKQLGLSVDWDEKFQHARANIISINKLFLEL